MPRQILRAVAVAAFALVASPAFADSMNMNVNATVTGVCKMISTPAMSFTIDPSVAGPATASSIVTYKCTKNTTPSSVTVGTSASPYAGSLSSGTVAGTIAYTVTWTNPTAAGAGFAQTAQSVTLSGSIADTAYQDAIAANDYSATVAVAINN